MLSALSRFIYGDPIVNEKDQLANNYTPIPQPPTIPFLGNTTSLDRTLPHQSFRLLWKQYGEIYQLDFPGRRVVVINSQRLAVEVLDEKRFYKIISGGLNELRGLVGDGLFTARHGEPNWALAHRILTPAFSPGNIKGMFDDMFDICSQLVLKWERYGPEHLISPAEDFTRLAFDTVALCTMHYRLNSYYNDGLHPFITSMGSYLLEAQRRATLPGFAKALSSSAQWDADKKIMDDIVNKVISDRRSSGVHYGDLLDLMLDGKDPQTGEALEEENIRYQLLTFLIAGHETTSGMLSFITYELMKNPHAYAKVREEVDTVLQGKPIQPEHLSKLPYIVAVMREGLRLYPPATAIGLAPFEDTTLGGEFFIPKGTVTVITSAWLQRDPVVWGEDAEEFKPERMLDGKFEVLPPKAWLPFGNGARACIGRAFAWQEAIICLATLFQRFDFILADSSYSLRLKQTLTIKPDEFYIRAIPRDGVSPLVVGSKQPTKTTAPTAQPSQNVADVKGKMNILYGSNTGSSEAFAQRMVSAAASKGFHATISTLDAASGHLSTTEPTIIITASFEGEPADNAGRFVEELLNLSGSELEGVAYTVFGCGNRDWAATYQRIPRLIDETMEKRGAKRLLPRGEGDAAGAEFFDSFDAWEAELWTTLAELYDVHAIEGAPEGFEVQVADLGMERAISLRQPDAALGKVVKNTVLTSNSHDEKRHIEFDLPAGMAYSAGDYLAVLPTNPPESVKRVLKHFGLSQETIIVIKAGSSTTLPTGRPVELKQVLNGYVELAQPATKRNMETLIEVAEADTKVMLRKMAETYKESIMDRRLSVLDLLCAYPTLKISLSTYLNMVPAMRVRQYSISSSPLWNSGRVSLTISVVNAPSISGSGERFLGVASNFLASLQPGDLVQLMVRPSASVFSLPMDVTVPLVLFCAGSGLAPMRGFIQERAMQIQSGRKDVGKVLLFFGCRYPDQDYLYSDSDLKVWTEMGAVEVRPAFSRALEKSEGCRYVQDRIIRDAADVKAMYRQHAKFFTCGGPAAAAGIRSACLALFEQELGSHDKAVEAFKSFQKERYATDIFG